MIQLLLPLCLVSRQTQSNPFDQITSPVVLYRTDSSSAEWAATNRGLLQLARLQPRQQIACELAMIREVRASAPRGRASVHPGIPYEWYPQNDLGKLDLVAIALKKPPKIESNIQVSFIKRRASVRIGVVRASNDGLKFPEEYDQRRPVAITDHAAYVRARRLILAGYYVFPHRHRKGGQIPIQTNDRALDAVAECEVAVASTRASRWSAWKRTDRTYEISAWQLLLGSRFGRFPGHCSMGTLRLKSNPPTSIGQTSRIRHAEGGLEGR